MRSFHINLKQGTPIFVWYAFGAALDYMNAIGFEELPSTAWVIRNMPTQEFVKNYGSKFMVLTKNKTSVISFK